MRDKLFRKVLVVGIMILFFGVSVIPTTTSFPLKESFNQTEDNATYQTSQFNPRDMDYNEHLIYDPVREYDSRFLSKEITSQYLRELFGYEEADSFYQNIISTDMFNNGDYTPHDPINIQSDDDFTEENGVTGGSGTEEDPYIIEGWEIHGNQYGIRIWYTTSHFIVRYCLLSARYAIDFKNVIFGTVSTVSTNGYGVGTYVRLSSNITIQDSILFGGNGLVLKDSVFVSVNNCSVSISSQYGDGIRLDGLQFSTLSNMTISESYLGIVLRECSETITSDCDVFFNHVGVLISRSQNLILRNNSMYENIYNLGIRGESVNHYYHDIDKSNMINGKPVYLIYNESDLVFNGSENIGFLGLIRCTRISVKELMIQSNDHGLLLVETTNSSIASSTFSNNIFGFTLFGCLNNTIVDCRILGGDAVYGIDLIGGSSMNHILDCEVQGGILLEKAPFNVLRNNTISGEYINFQVFGNKISDFYQDVDESNTIDGKPIFYFIGENNLNIYGSNIGYLGFVNCSNVRVHDITIKCVASGILLVNTKAIIERCKLWTCSWGVHLFECSDVKIIDCNIKYNFCGVYLHYSSDNQVFRCDLSDNWWHGCLLENSDNNLIKRCDVYNTGMDAFFIEDSYENEMHYNNIAGSGQNGLLAKDSSINATLNWWGSASGPSGLGPGNGDSIHDYDSTVLFEPWLKSPVIRDRIRGIDISRDFLNSFFVYLFEQFPILQKILLFMRLGLQ